MSNCPSCGTQSLNDSQFCHKCGCNLSGETGKLDPKTVLENRYVIVKTLGKGGMGAVYEALDLRLNNTPVVIKEMSTKAVGTGNLQAAIAAFKKEASMLISLSHPALPIIKDFFSRGEDRWYLVMDYIEGETLAEAVNRRGPIPQVEVLDWAIQLCEILEYLHGQEPPVIFRDLKPSNIMVTPKGKIKLIDFGIARHFRPGSTNDTAAYGSAGYAPPEQYGENQTDARSDIYALGAVLHFLLTGKDPTKNPFNFESPGKSVPVSPALDAAIMKALSLKPMDRPGSAGEMLVQIRENRNTTGGTTSTLPAVEKETVKIPVIKNESNSSVETTDLKDQRTGTLLINKDQTKSVAGSGTKTLPANNTPVTKGAGLEGLQKVGTSKESNGMKWAAALIGLAMLATAGWLGLNHLNSNANKLTNNVDIKSKQEQEKQKQELQNKEAELQKQIEEQKRQEQELHQKQQEIQRQLEQEQDAQRKQELERQQQELERQQELQKQRENELHADEAIDYGAVVYSSVSKEIPIGSKNVVFGPICVKENRGGSLIGERTIYFLFAEGIVISNSSCNIVEGDIRIDYCNITNEGYRSRVIYKINSESQMSSTISFSFEGNVSHATYEGDIRVTVGGTAGAAGEVVVGKAFTPPPTD